MIKPRILHVTESLGSGTAIAIRDYVTSAPEFEHRVIGYVRPGAEIGEALGAVADVELLHGGLARQAVETWRAIRRFSPDIVHVHSSKAGLYARLVTSLRSIPVVYTPHCFAFERRDLGRLTRASLLATETLLSYLTSAIVAVSPREAELAGRLRGCSRIVHVPNVVRLPVATRSRRPGSAGRLRVAMAGRICPQKSPRFFLEAARAAAAAGYGTDWVWVGGGPRDAEQMLRDAGVSVTGWLSWEAAIEELSRCDVYAHTAEWEGCPLTVLEAAALELPIVARHIPALRDIEELLFVTSPEAMASEVGRLVDTAARDAVSERSRRITARHDPDAQRKRLAPLYRELSTQTSARSLLRVRGSLR